MPPPLQNTKKFLPRKLLPWVSILGMVALSYLLGAAVLFFDLPSANFLHKAFLGAQAWYEQRHTQPPEDEEQFHRAKIGRIDKPEKTFPGFTLYMAGSWDAATSSHAFLINMKGEVVHKWAKPFSKVQANSPQVSAPISDSKVSFFAGHLFPNGDLLVVFHGMQQFHQGYCLVKLDKDSNILWHYPGMVHHDVNVGEDGTIYALKNELIRDLPRGLDFLPSPCLVDYLVILSPEGHELKKPIPIAEAFRDSPYAELLLPSAERPPTNLEDWRVEDAFHTNSVRVLTREMASHFPMFKEGQVLLSLRSLNTIAVLDPDKRQVIWAARGSWRAQHDAQFLEDGHLLLFDNLGPRKGSRVLEYDPQTQAYPWAYSGENGLPFLSTTRGMCQRLPNRNTLIVDSQGQTILEVTADKEVVWTCSIDGFVNFGRRYSPAQLPFLKGVQRARP
jgi:hypothetical protein